MHILSSIQDRLLEGGQNLLSNSERGNGKRKRDRFLVSKVEFVVQIPAE